MNWFEVEVSIDFKFRVQAEDVNDLWAMEPEELRSMVYKNLPASSGRKIGDLVVVDIVECAGDGNTIPFPKTKK